MRPPLSSSRAHHRNIFLRGAAHESPRKIREISKANVLLPWCHFIVTNCEENNLRRDITEKERGNRVASITITRSAMPKSSTSPYPRGPTNAAAASATKYKRIARVESPVAVCWLLAKAFYQQQREEDPSRAQLWLQRDAHNRSRHKEHLQY